MSYDGPLSIHKDVSQLPSDPGERHEELVDCFGQFLFWIRNWSLAASRKLIESEEAREKLGTIRRRYYDGVAQMNAEQRQAAMLLVEETLNGFGERFVWFLGGKGTDLTIGPRHAFRFHVEMEIIDIDTEEVVEREPITKGRKFFGSYWGRWLNRHRDK
jgi:hypothetical protein